MILLRLSGGHQTAVHQDIKASDAMLDAEVKRERLVSFVMVRPHEHGDTITTVASVGTSRAC